MPFKKCNFLVLCLLITNFAIGQNQAILSGTINGLDRNSTVYLSQTSLDVLTDSVIVKYEKFSFNIKTSKGDIYFLRFSINAQEYSEAFYIQKGSNIHFVVEKNGRLLNVSGSSLADEQYHFYNGMYQLYDDINKSKKSESTRDSAELEKINSAKETAYLESWIANHKSSPFSVAVIYLYMQEANANLTEKLYNNLSKTAKINNLVTNIMPVWFAKRKLVDPIPIGTYYPGFNLFDTSGKPISFAKFQGKDYILIDIWASWCGPCRKSTPEIINLVKQYSNRNFKVISISADTSAVLWKEAVVNDKMTWQQLSDLRGTDAGLMLEYSIFAYPTYIILSPEGIILSKPVNIERVKEKLNQILQ